MKKRLAAMLAAVTILFVFVMTTAFAAEVTPQTPARTTVKVGYLENYGIINTPIVQGSEGYGCEYLEKLEEYTDYNFEYVSLTWAEGLVQLKAGEIDLLAPASITEERKEIYDFVDTVFSYDETTIYALEESDYQYGEPEQMYGKVFGTLEGSVYGERFRSYAREHGLDCVVKYTDPATVVQDLESGEIDLYVDGSLYLRSGIHSVDKISAEGLYLMAQKGNDSLTSNLNAAMLALEADNPFFNEILWTKYYGTTNKAVQKLTEEEVIALQSKDVYTVGYHADLHPLSYILPNGNPKGYAIDVMDRLADQLGIQIRYVPLHAGREYTASSVDFNLCPMNHDSGIYGTLSEPYDMQKLLAVRENGLNKSDVQHILAPDYATIEIEHYLELYPSATVHKVDSSADCQVVHDTEDIDCSIIPDNSEVFLEDREHKSIGALGVSVPIGITVSNQLPLQVRIALDKAILSLKESTVDDLVMDNVRALQRELTLTDILITYQIEIVTVVALIVATFVFVLWESRKKTKRLLEVDALTGVMTPYKFTQEARRILATAEPNAYMMILLDIDKFKIVNKVYGTQFGDRLLCVLANSIKKQAKKGAIISRMQNDAFAILTKTSEIDQDTLYANFVTDLNQTGMDITVYFSGGVYVVENTADDISFMLDNAKMAKGYGKTIFGNTVHYFTKELQAKHEKESAILSSMERALADEEFFIVVQPKIALQTGKLIGGEVLVRWKRKDGTFIYPDEFIPLLEENKFIVQLDRYVLRKTCEWIRDSKQPLPVLSVNASATTMLESDFLQYGLEILEKYGVQPRQIEVELTESVLDADFEGITKTISALKQAGFSVAIDDFGKGASSLARITEIDMDVLKLDKDFITNNTENEKGKLVLKNVISMANDLGITSLAEGIETNEQQDLLAQLGCEQGQGYYFDRPLSTEDFMQRVETTDAI